MQELKPSAATLLLACSLFATPVDAAPVLWVGDSSGFLGTVDVANGDVTVIGHMGLTMTDIAFDPLGNLYGISFTELYQIDPSTAAVTLIGSTGIASNSLVFDAAGNLYTANDALYRLDPLSGAATLLGNGGVDYVSSGDLAFVAGSLFLSASGGDDLIRLDRNNGAASLVGSIGYASVFGLATDNNVDLYGLAGTDVLTIDPVSGAGSVLLSYAGTGLGPAYGSAFTTEAAVPIPATFGLMLSGLGVLFGWLRRPVAMNQLL